MATRSGLQKWFPEFFERYQAVTVFDLLKSYLEEGRIRVDRSKNDDRIAYHDPCNYGRKSQQAFGQDYFKEARWILDQVAEDWVDLYPNQGNQYCCGGGGGTLLTPHKDERFHHGLMKLEQIKRVEPDVVVVPCHSCHGQINAMLRQNKMGYIEVKYLWQIVADALVKK